MNILQTIGDKYHRPSAAFTQTVFTGTLTHIFFWNSINQTVFPLCLLRVSRAKFFLSLHHLEITLGFEDGWLPQRKNRSDPSSLRSLYITHHHCKDILSALCKIAVCPLKDYRFDRIHINPALRGVGCVISTNRTVRRCRWGGQ